MTTNMNQIDSNAGVADPVYEFSQSLPPLPSVLRYYDDFDATLHSISDPTNKSTFEIVRHGSSSFIKFLDRDPACSFVLKHVMAMMLSQDISSATIASYFSKLHHLSDDDIRKIISSTPLTVTLLWKELRSKEMTVGVYMLAKHIFHLMCAYRWKDWSVDYRPLLGTSLPLPAVDKYASIRAGNVFLSVNHEAKIVQFLDEISVRLTGGEALTFDEIANAGMVLSAYQFAMRPVQIGMLDLSNVRIWNDGISEIPTVHLTFHMAKQRGANQRIGLTRRVKREWVPIFTSLKEMHGRRESSTSAKLFLVNSAALASTRIAQLVRQVIGEHELGTATDLRHTAAQRLVDAGASHEELAEFMGHAQTNTGLIYYETSVNQAERINKALGISDVYQNVVKIANARFISPEALAELKGEQQIAAVPHGIPISEIGGCQSGQPSCPFNPVTSCYGCRKFIPVSDKRLHQDVLKDMRDIVVLFEKSSRGDSSSPAYMQLQRTISEVQSVIEQLNEVAS